MTAVVQAVLDDGSVELTAEKLQARLAPRAVRFYEQVDSTNDLALAWLLDGAPPGAVVVADEQVRGRGRLGRSWFTPPGTALILSLVLRPALSSAHQTTMLGSLAIHELLVGLGLERVGIKWPNDVQVNGLKVSGVLPEAVWNGPALRGVALGMGVNVRIDFSGTELAATATSIETALGAPVDRLDLLAGLLDEVDRLLENEAAVYPAWKQRLTTLGQTVSLEGGRIQGVAEDVDEDGALLVRTPAGDLQRVMAGDIELGGR